MYQHLEALKQKLLSLPIQPPPSPWQLITSISVGGLCSVGFDRTSDQLLIVSHQGRGVVDCRTGQKTARDDEDYDDDNEIHLEAVGIGPLNHKVIRMTGLYGGGLPLSTDDGWSLEAETVNWPEQMLLLLPPGSSVYGSLSGHPDNMIKIDEEVCLRAYGFSYTGKSLILATTSDVTIFGR